MKSNEVEPIPSPPVVRVSLRSRITQRQRMVRIGSVIAMVLLAFVVILGNTAQTRNMLLGLFAGPGATPTTALTPSQSLFYVDASPGWGQLSIDGHTLAWQRLSFPYAPLHLSVGHHQVLWHAAPFRTLHCSISVPASEKDTCLHRSVDIQEAPMLQTLMLYDSLPMLSGNIRTSLKQTVQQALDAVQSSETVQPGEHFLHSSVAQAIDRAKQPLHATLHFQLDTTNAPNSTCSINIGSCTLPIENVSQDCLAFCTWPDMFDARSTKAGVWHAVVIVHALWDYTLPDGTTVARNQPDALPVYTQFEHLVPMQITWDGAAWHAVVDSTKSGLASPAHEPLACTPTEDVVGAVMAYDPSGKTSTDYGWSSATASGRTPAQGCLIVIELIPNSTGPSTTAGPDTHDARAYCLYRFGVLLAANDVAHQFWPHLPLADSYERGLAQQLALSMQSLP